MKRLNEFNITLEIFLLRFADLIVKIRTVLLILAVIGVVAFYIWGIGESDIELFPFDSIRWGEVSSWLALLISLISMALIYRTFRSQKEIQFLENKRYRSSLIPRFSFEPFYTPRPITEKDTHLQLAFEFRVVAQHNLIQNIKVELVDDAFSGEEKKFYDKPSNKIIHTSYNDIKNELFKVNTEIKNIRVFEGNPQLKSQYLIKFWMCFQDWETNEYKFLIVARVKKDTHSNNYKLDKVNITETHYL